MQMYNKINNLLKEKNIKKTKMCLDLEISYNSLMSMFNRQSRNIALGTVQSIADYLDVTIDYLIRDEITDPNYGKSSDSKEDVYIEEQKLSDIDKPIIDKFLKLTERNKYRVEGKIDDYLLEQGNDIEKENTNTYDELSATTQKKIEEKVELYRNELIESQKGGTLSATPIQKEKIS